MTRVNIGWSELVSRYQQASWQEAPGLLYALAKLVDVSKKDRIHFLMKIGDENKLEGCITESSSNLRFLARKLLVRHIISGLLVSKQVTEFDLVLAQQCTMFFASHTAHARLDNRDLKTLQEFFERSFKCHETMRPKTDTGYTYLYLVEALVYAQHFSYLDQQGLTEAVIYIYSSLHRQMPKGQFDLSQYLLSSALWLKALRPQDTIINELKACNLLLDLGKIMTLGGYILSESKYARLVPAAEAMMRLAAIRVNEMKKSMESILRPTCWLGPL